MNMIQVDNFAVISTKKQFVVVIHDSIYGAFPATKEGYAKILRLFKDDQDETEMVDPDRVSSDTEAVIGERIKQLRESKGFTQQQLADVVGARSYTTITKWEKGENCPKGKDIIKLCKYFNVSSDYLLGLDQN